MLSLVQAEYQDVVPMFSIVNEALLKTIGQDPMTNLCVVFFPCVYALGVDWGRVQLPARTRYDS